MPTKIYNKLVRDKIPEIVQQDNKVPVTRIAGEEEYYQLLVAKLAEEGREFAENPSKEELSDLLEVIDALATWLGCDLSDIEELRLQKRQKRGGFTERIVLIQVEEESEQQ